MGDRVISLRDLLECMPHVPSIIAKWDSMQLLSCECFFLFVCFFEKIRVYFDLFLLKVTILLHVRTSYIVNI